MDNLIGRKIAIVVGHEPGGGAEGERSFNMSLSVIMRNRLVSSGADVYIHHHKIRSYGARQDAMRDAVNDNMPDCDVCVELHFNSYDKEAAHGHEFLYNGSKALAEAFRDEFQASFPWSTARADDGIKHTPTGRGSGFLRKAPAWAVLVEPFFDSNKKEHDYFTGRQTCLAETYCEGLDTFFYGSK